MKHPNLKMAMSEGGIGWVPMLLDRLDYIVDHSKRRRRLGRTARRRLAAQLLVLHLEDRSTIDTRYRIGVEHIMVEVDYPHGDSTWPDTQLVIDDAWGHLPSHELRALCCENAAALYRHPLPDRGASLKSEPGSGPPAVVELTGRHRSEEAAVDLEVDAVHVRRGGQPRNASTRRNLARRDGTTGHLPDVPVEDLVARGGPEVGQQRRVDRTGAHGVRADAAPHRRPRRPHRVELDNLLREVVRRLAELRDVFVEPLQ